MMCVRKQSGARGDLPLETRLELGISNQNIFDTDLRTFILDVNLSTGSIGSQIKPYC